MDMMDWIYLAGIFLCWLIAAVVILVCCLASHAQSRQDEYEHDCDIDDQAWL